MVTVLLLPSMSIPQPVLEISPPALPKKRHAFSQENVSLQTLYFKEIKLTNNIPFVGELLGRI
jgi:hypothetical protein